MFGAIFAFISTFILLISTMGKIEWIENKYKLFLDLFHLMGHFALSIASFFGMAIVGFSCDVLVGPKHSTWNFENLGKKTNLLAFRLEL